MNLYIPTNTDTIRNTNNYVPITRRHSHTHSRNHNHNSLSED
jgi:hypothetical protein